MNYLLRPRLCSQNGGLRVAVSEDARKCVVFFGLLIPPKKGADSTKPNEIQYSGTGFVVSHHDNDGYRSDYLVTCRHVAKHLEDDFFIRMNTVAGGAEQIPIENAEWQYHPDSSVDIAATVIGIDGLHFDHRALPLTKAATRDRIFCGQRIHIAGLFRLHYGEKRNIPIVHTGHIAALADPREKVAIKDRVSGKQILAESHIVEAQTLEGLSGSPVFVQEYYPWQTKDDLGGDTTIAAFGNMTLLGVYQAAWDALPGAILAEDRNLSGSQRVPVGMGIVVPIERVIELIEGNDMMKKWRENKKEEKRSENAATMDSGFSAPPANDANPTHLEDFTRLVDVAARKKPKD
jgi:hypothetical protein